MALSRQAVDIAMAGDIKRGLAMALEARQRAQQAGDAHAELTALNAVARCHTMRHDAIAALAIGIDAAALAKAQGDRLAFAHALSAIAISTFSLQLLEESLEIAMRAVADAVSLHDDDLEARARQAYGLVLSDLQRFDEAREQFTLSFEAAERQDRPAFAHRVLANLATLHRKEARQLHKQGELARAWALSESAIESAREVIALAEQDKNETLAINMYGSIGEMRAVQGDYAGAIEATQYAIDMAVRLKQHGVTIPASLRLAAYRRERGEYHEARTALEHGLQVAELLRPTFRIAEFCEALSQVEGALGGVAAADRWRQRALTEHASFERERETARDYLLQLRDEIMPAFSISGWIPATTVSTESK